MSNKKLNKSSLVKKLDKIFSEFIRISNADNNGNTKCVTCGKVENWKLQDCGHFMSRIHMSTRWNENNVGPQCKYCNRYCQGKQFEFSRYLGEELSEELYLLSKQTQKFTEDAVQHRQVFQQVVVMQY
jgi:hypothetical protein